ncbi:hypothetical protein B6N60_03314 [Richelia sinica FACHB-800]|uniref:Uncharacterized protein n=1 Tax=Richelia sinica FACHB-800 TaxID=1357546 RepID=A0A975T9P6_9NOST|nr:hypothetical protein B6N60_03314 [Richelia sinica FACHB-800]
MSTALAEITENRSIIDIIIKIIENKTPIIAKNIFY